VDENGHRTLHGDSASGNIAALNRSDGGVEEADDSVLERQHSGIGTGTLLAGEDTAKVGEVANRGGKGSSGFPNWR